MVPWVTATSKVAVPRRVLPPGGRHGQCQVSLEEGQRAGTTEPKPVVLTERN